MLQLLVYPIIDRTVRFIASNSPFNNLTLTGNNSAITNTGLDSGYYYRFVWKIFAISYLSNMYYLDP